MSILIAISASSKEQALIAATLAKQSDIPLLADLSHPPRFDLHLNDNGVLSLRDNDNPNITALSIDFIGGKNRHRRLYGGGKGQQLAKAIGFNKYSHLNIIDATAGLGRDAYVMASLGGKVILLERQASVALLLENALQQGLLNNDPDITKIIQRMTLVTGDSYDYLHALKQPSYPDVIYIDPMFPERRKQAKVKKEMQFFHQLVGKDHDADKLLGIALQRAKKRIVVKRPRTADTLNNTRKPAFELKGKSTRYDVYLPITARLA